MKPIPPARSFFASEFIPEEHGLFDQVIETIIEIAKFIFNFAVAIGVFLYSAIDEITDTLITSLFYQTFNEGFGGSRPLEEKFRALISGKRRSCDLPFWTSVVDLNPELAFQAISILTRRKGGEWGKKIREMPRPPYHTASMVYSLLDSSLEENFRLDAHRDYYLYCDRSGPTLNTSILSNRIVSSHEDVFRDFGWSDELCGPSLKGLTRGMSQAIQAQFSLRLLEVTLPSQNRRGLIPYNHRDHPNERRLYPTYSLQKDPKGDFHLYVLTIQELRDENLPLEPLFYTVGFLATHFSGEALKKELESARAITSVERSNHFEISKQDLSAFATGKGEAFGPHGSLTEVGQKILLRSFFEFLFASHRSLGEQFENLLENMQEPHPFS